MYICICMGIYWIIPQSVFTLKGFWRIFLWTSGSLAGYAAVYAGQLLCAGCGDRACHLRHSHTKCRVAPVSTVTHTCFGTFCLQDTSGLPGASWVPPGCLLGVSWVPPGRSWWVSPGCFLGASWVPPGCLWAPFNQDVPAKWSQQIDIKPDGWFLRGWSNQMVTQLVSARLGYLKWSEGGTLNMKYCVRCCIRHMELDVVHLTYWTRCVVLDIFY
jgi:hypothetical protein